jgi:hypothetical protein
MQATFSRPERGIHCMGHQGDSLFSISIFAISVTQGDFSVLDFNDAVIGQRE